MASKPVREGAPQQARIVLLAPLRHRAFRLLFGGQVVSNLGDWLDLLALLALIAYQWRLGAGALAGLTLAMLLPSAIVAPVAGVFVDRWPKRRTMIACDLGRAALALGLVWAPNIIAVLSLVLAMAILSAFFSPARQAAIRLAVPEDDLLPANALSRLSVNVTKVIGPGLGGALVALVGARAAFVADALTFVISAAFLARLILPASPDADPQSDFHTDAQASPLAPTIAIMQRFWRDFRQGVAYILRTPVLAIAVGAMMAELLIVETNDSLTVLAFKGLGMGEALVGLAIGCSGLGNVLGALALGQWGSKGRPLRQMGAGFLLVGVVEAAIGAALLMSIRGDVRWLPTLVVSGVGFAAIWVPFGYILQRETPPEFMGRVSATASALYTTIGLAGPPLGAILAQRFGVGFVFTVTGGALACLGLPLILVRLPATLRRL